MNSDLVARISNHGKSHSILLRPLRWQRVSRLRSRTHLDQDCSRADKEESRDEARRLDFGGIRPLRGPYYSGWRDPSEEQEASVISGLCSVASLARVPRRAAQNAMHALANLERPCGPDEPNDS
mmetsp:Transcript_8384/g.31567  ORF Transcript_8384/g.31567 Transcript_8384/m.31567 type:complete len:124 (-) Transcript_8384:23-394(-)|eukprot:scaffold2671_cov252-Pinguiococcus_pyrenoidosus.AAC.17